VPGLRGGRAAAGAAAQTLTRRARSRTSLSAQALVVLGLSIAGFLVLAGVLLRRRDLA